MFVSNKTSTLILYKIRQKMLWMIICTEIAKTHKKYEIDKLLSRFFCRCYFFLLSIKQWKQRIKWKKSTFYSRARVMIAPIFDEKKWNKNYTLFIFFHWHVYSSVFLLRFFAYFGSVFSYFSYEILAVISKHFNVRILA